MNELAFKKWFGKLLKTRSDITSKGILILTLPELKKLLKHAFKFGNSSSLTQRRKETK